MLYGISKLNKIQLCIKTIHYLAYAKHANIPFIQLFQDCKQQNAAGF